MILFRVLITFFLILTAIIVIGAIALIPLYGKKWRLVVRRIWIRMILWGLNVQIKWQGAIPRQPSIIVANHRSYLDPLLIMTKVLALPVAKAEMAKWPLLGLAGKISGIFYVQRESPRDRKRTLLAITQAVREGETILIFPEGTTHSEDRTIAFKKGVFQVAAQEGVPIIPVALDFRDKADYWLANDSFAGHFLRRFGWRRVRCSVVIGQPLRHHDADTLLSDASIWIDEMLPVIQEELRRGKS